MSGFEFKLDPRAQQHVKTATERFLGDIGEDIVADAKRFVPVRSGKLRDSLVAEVVEGELRVGSVDVDYALAVEYGTAPHAIRAKNGKALSWPGADHPVAEVNHPGTQAHPYLRPALFQRRTG